MERPRALLRRRGRPWNGRGHFFAAAAEAMRRILVEAARKKGGPERGGGWGRVALDDLPGAAGPDDRLLDLDDALARLRAADPLAARVVDLRFFAGLTMQEAADALGLTLRTAERNWTFARTWLRRALADRPEADG